MARSIYTEQEAQFLKNIGYRVQFFRKKAGLSQEELAERCGMSYSTISHIESTSPYPMSIVALYRIANVLGISPYQLQDLTEQQAAACRLLFVSLFGF